MSFCRKISTKQAKKAETYTDVSNYILVTKLTAIITGIMHRGLQIFQRRGAFPIQMSMSMSTHTPIHRLWISIPRISHLHQSKRAKINKTIASAEIDDSSSTNSNGSDGGHSWAGVGPEGLAEEPVLQDLLMGMGSSGDGPGEKPEGAPGTLKLLVKKLSNGHSFNRKL